MKDLLVIKHNINLKRDMLKLKLEQKEIVQYNTWKSLPENTSSREAMEKTVAKLKLEDEGWLLEEVELIELKNRATLVNNIYEVLIGTLNNGTDETVINNIANSYINDLDLGQYL